MKMIEFLIFLSFAMGILLFIFSYVPEIKNSIIHGAFQTMSLQSLLFCLTLIICDYLVEDIIKQLLLWLH